MTILLVILTFAVFIAADVLLERRARARAIPVMPAPRGEPVFVAGYELPDGLSYHRGHTWVRPEGDTVVVGLDDFARRLIGPAETVRLPARGDWLRQGESVFGIGVLGRSASLLSPVEGEVVAVNRDLRREPALATEDPFGRGWLVRVRAAHLAENLRTLISGSLARKWIEDSREGLDLRLMALSGSVLQDGGEPVADFARHLSNDDWQRLVGEFLLT